MIKGGMFTNDVSSISWTSLTLLYWTISWFIVVLILFINDDQYWINIVCLKPRLHRSHPRHRNVVWYQINIVLTSLYLYYLVYIVHIIDTAIFNDLLIDWFYSVYAISTIFLPYIGGNFERYRINIVSTCLHEMFLFCFLTLCC